MSKWVKNFREVKSYIETTDTYEQMLRISACFLCQDVVSTDVTAVDSRIWRWRTDLI